MLPHILDLNYGLKVLNPVDEVVHVSLYGSPPTNHDRNDLLMELHMDPEFGLTEAIGLRTEDMTPEEVAEIKADVEHGAKMNIRQRLDGPK